MYTPGIRLCTKKNCEFLNYGNYFVPFWGGGGGAVDMR